MLFRTLAATFLSFAVALPIQAQTFPDGPIKWIVNWPAGGGQDTTSRLVAEALSAKLGVPVVVENHSGAGGLTGMRKIASASADGYTIGMLGSSSVIQQYTTEQPVRLDELSVLAFFGPDPAALTVNAKKGPETLAKYVEKARNAPGSVVNGNDPPGGASFISAAVLESALDLKLLKIPYKGYAPTVTALLGGEVESATVPVPQVLEHHRNGTVRILGVMAGTRHFMAPDIPTFAEQGFNLTAGDFRAIVGPKGMPADRMAKLSAALIEVMSSADFVKKANAAGYMIEALGPEPAMQRIETFDAQVYPVLKEAGLVTNPR